MPRTLSNWIFHATLVSFLGAGLCSARSPAAVLVPCLLSLLYLDRFRTSSWVTRRIYLFGGCHKSAAVTASSRALLLNNARYAIIDCILISLIVSLFELPGISAHLLMGAIHLLMPVLYILYNVRALDWIVAILMFFVRGILIYPIAPRPILEGQLNRIYYSLALEPRIPLNLYRLW